MKKNHVDEFIRRPRKALFTISLPIVVAMLVQALYNIVDTAFVGRLGAQSIAALTFAFPIFFILMALNSGVSVGMGSRISRMLGAKRKSAAENAALHGVLVSLALSLVIFVLGMVFLEPLFGLFGASDAVLELSIGYMSVILFGVFFMFPAFVLNSIFSAQGDTRTPMKVQISALLLNAVLDPVFIYVLGFGVQGAAIATVIAFAFALGLSVYYVHRRSYLRLCISCFRLDLRMVGEIFRIGAPASLTMLIMSFYIIFVNRIMAHFGTDYVASFGIVSRLESITVLPTVAFSLGILTLVGMFYGAKRYDLLKDITAFSIKVSVAFTIAIGILFFALPRVFLMIFTSDQTLLSLGSAYLRVNLFAFPLFAVTMIVSRATQGMGLGMPGLVINIARLFVVALPTAYVAIFVFGYGYLSVAVSMVLGALVSAVLGFAWLEWKIRKLNHAR